MKKLLMLFAVLMLVLPLVANAIQYGGTIKQVKTSAPYPFEARDGVVWVCKVVVAIPEWDEEGYWEVTKYKAYPSTFDDPAQNSTCHDVNGNVIDSCSYKVGTEVWLWTNPRPNSPKRGEVIHMHAITQP